MPTAVALEPGKADELWIKDARLEEISGPAFVFGVENNPRNEVNMERVSRRGVPVFVALRDSGKHFTAPAASYLVKTFSHGLHYSDIGAVPRIRTLFDAAPLAVAALWKAGTGSMMNDVRFLGGHGTPKPDGSLVFLRPANGSGKR